MQKQNTGNMSGLRRTRSSFIRSAAVTHCICCVYVFLCVSTNLSLTEQFEILIRGEEKLMWGLLAVSSVSETCSCQTCCITPHNSCSTYWLLLNICRVSVRDHILSLNPVSDHITDNSCLSRYLFVCLFFVSCHCQQQAKWKRVQVLICNSSHCD